MITFCSTLCVNSFQHHVNTLHKTHVAIFSSLNSPTFCWDYIKQMSVFYVSHLVLVFCLILSRMDHFMSIASPSTHPHSSHAHPPPCIPSPMHNLPQFSGTDSAVYFQMSTQLPTFSGNLPKAFGRFNAREQSLCIH